MRSNTPVKLFVYCIYCGREWIAFFKYGIDTEHA